MHYAWVPMNSAWRPATPHICIVLSRSYASLNVSYLSFKPYHRHRSRSEREREKGGGGIRVKLLSVLSFVLMFYAVLDGGCTEGLQCPARTLHKGTGSSHGHLPSLEVCVCVCVCVFGQTCITKYYAHSFYLSFTDRQADTHTHTHTHTRTHAHTHAHGHTHKHTHTHTHTHTCKNAEVHVKLNSLAVSNLQNPSCCVCAV